MILAYTLSMPRANSWDGRWSGEDQPHTITRSYQARKQFDLVNRILINEPYHYNWGDGWGVVIEVQEVDSRQAAEIRRTSAGFAGYEWMVDTIEQYGKPLATHELPKIKESKA